MITHLEPDILECKVKWALGSITMNKATGGDRIPAELFQILKDDAVKVLHSICQEIRKTQQWLQNGKRSVFIPITKKGNAKECLNYCTVAVISHTSKVMSLLFNMLSRLAIVFFPKEQASFNFMATVTICSDFGVLGSITINNASGGIEFQLSYFKS